MSLRKRVVALRWSAVAIATAIQFGFSQTFASAQSEIFNPATAPTVHVNVKGTRIAKSPPTASGSVVTAKIIAQTAGTSTVNKLIRDNTPGAASSINGELHIRGSHGQYSTYLDGAPLPPNVTGSFSDLINPNNIEVMRIYTGGFPAEYGGQMAAIFDITTKTGTGAPHGTISDYIGSFKTNERTIQVEGSEGRLGYFATADRTETAFDLSPFSETPLHNDGRHDTVFGKFDYKLSGHDKLTLDTAEFDTKDQIPYDPSRIGLDQDDHQTDSGDFANLIWQHLDGKTSSHVAFYNHDSHLIYYGSPADLLPGPGATSVAGLIETNENQTADYKGIRADYSFPLGKYNQPKIGLDISRVTSTELFNLVSPPSTGFAPISDNSFPKGGDQGYYVQDDWTSRRLLTDAGLRYDQHNADITTSQFSPRLNFSYTAGKRDEVHWFYDRLFQPAPIEDVRSLNGQSAIGSSGPVVPFQPERDDFFQTGWKHKLGQQNIGVDAYYRAEKNTIDDSLLGNSLIDVPVNFEKGYARGLESTVDGPISKTVDYYANFAQSYAKEHGPITGGLTGGITGDPNYFYDDHDQTYTVSFGVDYDHDKRYINLTGDYGSGYPYGQLTDASGNTTAINYIFVPGHISFDLDAGVPIPDGAIAFSVTNLFNKPYVITEAGPFSDVQWAEGRAYGVKVTLDF